MLYVDRVALDRAVDTFAQMVATARTSSGRISTERIMGDRTLVARHLIAAIGVLCSPSDAICVAPADTVWLAGNASIGVEGVRIVG